MSLSSCRSATTTTTALCLKRSTKTIWKQHFPPAQQQRFLGTGSGGQPTQPQLLGFLQQQQHGRQGQLLQQGLVRYHHTTTSISSTTTATTTVVPNTTTLQAMNYGQQQKQQHSILSLLRRQDDARLPYSRRMASTTTTTTDDDDKGGKRKKKTKNDEDDTIRLKDVRDRIASQHDITKGETKRILDTLTNEIVTSLMKGKSVVWYGLGKWELVWRPERQFSNPQNPKGPKVTSNAKYLVKFRVSSRLAKNIAEEVEIVDRTSNTTTTTTTTTPK